MLLGGRDGCEERDQTNNRLAGVCRTKYLTTVSVPRKLCGIFGSSGHDFAIIISRARGAVEPQTQSDQLPIINQLSFQLTDFFTPAI